MPCLTTHEIHEVGTISMKNLSAWTPMLVIALTRTLEAGLAKIVVSVGTDSDNAATRQCIVTRVPILDFWTLC